MYILLSKLRQINVENFTLEKETFLFVLCVNLLQNLQPEIFLARLVKISTAGHTAEEGKFANILAIVRHFLGYLDLCDLLICRPKNVEIFTLENVRLACKKQHRA